MAGSPATFIGNITQEPELRFLGDSGSAKLQFNIAVNHYWTDQSGEKQEKASFFTVVAWRNLGEDAANILEKGMRVVVSGRLEQRSYEDKEGNKRSVVELIADEIGVSTRNIASLERKQSSGEPASKARPQAASKRAAKTVDEDDEPF